MSPSASTTGSSSKGGKDAAPKISEKRKSKIFTPNQLSTVQGYISSCLADSVGSSLVGIRGLFRNYSFDLLENDALCKRQLSSLTKYERTSEGEKCIPQKFRYAVISYQRSPESNTNIKLKDLKVQSLKT